jgi:multimeric flavodoxin WrbA
MSASTIRVFACSPRSNGNTDLMAHTFVQGVHAAGGNAEVTSLRDHAVLPCTACRHCAEEADAGCRLAGSDGAETLFRQIEEAPLVCLLSPIFFYHLPAQLKCLIDRAQRYWVLRRIKSSPNRPAPPGRPGLVGLVGARARGEKLFDGSLLTLKYFFDLFDIRLVDGCRLRGYDQPDELARDGAACMRLHELGVKAAALVAAQAGCR